MPFESISARYRHLLGLPLTIALLTGFQNADAESARQTPNEDVKAADQAQSAQASIAHIPFNAPAHNLLIDDFDGDGHSDIAFTSHHDSYTQVFLQRTPRQFTAGPRVDAVGFHPGELIQVPGTEQRRYLMHAEGINRLRIFEPTAEGGLKPVSEIGAKAPRAGTFFNWPSWNHPGIAIAPFAKSMILLIKDFDPKTGHFGSSIELPFRPGAVHAHAITAADIDKDGADELLFTNTLTNTIAIVRQPKPDTDPVVETLWSFKPGGRPERITAADIDQDGDLDLLIADATDKRPLNRTDINVLINDGKGNFDLKQIEFTGRPRTEGGMPGIQSIDFAVDRDGYGYIIAIGYEQLTLMRIPRGWSGETPETRTRPLQRIERITKAALFKLDGDDWLDLVFARTNDTDSGVFLYGPLGDNMRLLENQGTKIQ